jgi:hypothetical protein
MINLEREHLIKVKIADDVFEKWDVLDQETQCSKTDCVPSTLTFLNLIKKNVGLKLAKKLNMTKTMMSRENIYDELFNTNEDEEIKNYELRNFKGRQIDNSLLDEREMTPILLSGPDWGHAIILGKFNGEYFFIDPQSKEIFFDIQLYMEQENTNSYDLLFKKNKRAHKLNQRVKFRKTDIKNHVPKKYRMTTPYPKRVSKKTSYKTAKTAKKTASKMNISKPASSSLGSLISKFNKIKLSSSPKKTLKKRSRNSSSSSKKSNPFLSKKMKTRSFSLIL